MSSLRKKGHYLCFCALCGIFVLFEIVSLKKDQDDVLTSLDIQSKQTHAENNNALFPQYEIPAECISPNNEIPIREIGKFVPSDYPPRYDHISGFLMKATYNCVKPQDYDSNRKEEVATDYHLVLKYDGSNKECDLRNLMNNVGGPQGVARILKTTSDAEPIRVLFQGHSHIRQIFEALVDGFRDQITDIRLLSGDMTPTPTFFGMEDIKKEGGGCHHSQDRIARYYNEGVTLPPDMLSDRCSSDIGMVEFAGAIRFYYIFRSQVHHDKLEYIYRNFFGFAENDEVDILYWNVYQGRSTYTPGLRPKRKVSLTALLLHLLDMQKEQLGYAFETSSAHGCMPGVPDDEVDLLLYQLLTGYTLIP